MADFKFKYPSANTVALTIGLGSLATNAQNVFSAGQESTAVDNTTNLDLDHLLSGRIRVGTTPTVSRTIAVYVYTPISITAGVPTYPDVLDGTDSAETFTSANVLNSSVRLVWSTVVDATTDRDYFFSGISIAAQFGGVMPPFWGVYVAHDTGVVLNATGSNHVLSYFRVQTQSV